METADQGVDGFIKQYYGSESDHFKKDLQEIIFMLHFIDSETITKEQIRNACGLLKDLSEAVGEG